MIDPEVLYKLDTCPPTFCITFLLDVVYNNGMHQGLIRYCDSLQDTGLGIWFLILGVLGHKP